MRAWMLGGMRFPLLVAVFLLASALAVPVPSGDSDGERFHSSSAQWHIHTVDKSPSTGYGTSIAVDSHGNPHIGYFDNANDTLRYARWTGSGWNIETVDTHGSVGWMPSIGLDSGDNPHISYSNSSWSLKYARLTGKTWMVETVVSGRHHKSSSSIALDSRDNPHVSYYDRDDFYIRFALRKESGWSIETVAFAGFAGGWTSIALDNSDSPHISYVYQPYYEPESRRLMLATWIGNSWNVETVDTCFRSQTSISVDDDNNVHISYVDLPGLKYAKRTGNAWSIQVADSTHNVGWDSSLALDAQGFPHISYKDGRRKALMYARWTGGVWEIETVDKHGMVGMFTSIALDNEGNPHISYYDIDNNNLKYATKADLTPPSGSLTLDIDPDTLNLKSKGRWITAYLSAENASVHDINVSTILLQDALAPERWDYQGDVLMLKFNRQEFKDTVQVGESVQVKITGKWEDGTAFEAYDSIRVIEQGKG